MAIYRTGKGFISRLHENTSCKPIRKKTNPSETWKREIVQNQRNSKWSKTNKKQRKKEK